MTPQEKHDTFVEAAMLIDCGKEKYSCIAIQSCGGNFVRYAEAIAPREMDRVTLIDVCVSCGHNKSAMRELRVMLLLFAAQMARTGDL